MQYNQGMINPYIQQQQQYYTYQQPYYQGAAYQNAVPIGGAGYNGGFNFGYYGYGFMSYDPLEIQRMREQEEERRINEYTNNINVIKRMVKATNYYMTGDNMSEQVDENYSYDKMKHEYEVQMNDMNMERLSSLNEYQQQQREQYYEQMVTEAEPVKNETLVQFLEGTATDRYMEVVNSKYNSQSRNIGRLYNHDNFAELVHLHNRDNNTNPIFNPMITVEDLEISLPKKLKDGYEERRAQFMQSILNNTPIGL